LRSKKKALMYKLLVSLDLTYLTDIIVKDASDDNEKLKAAFNRLVLPEGHMKLIQTLVAQHLHWEGKKDLIHAQFWTLANKQYLQERV
jgi:hypothetical protein